MARSAWAIVRIDDFLRDLFVNRVKSQTPAETLISVVTVLLDHEKAEQEVKRLTALRPAGSGSSYVAVTTALSDDVDFVRGTELVAVVRLVRFKATQPVVPGQVAVVGVFAREEDAWAAVPKRPPEVRQEHALVPTRIRRI